MSKITQHGKLHHQAQDYAVVTPTNYKGLDGWPDCIDRIIRFVNETDMIHNVPVRATVRPAHLVQAKAASDRINSLWLVNSHVRIDTYWTVHQETLTE